MRQTTHDYKYADYSIFFPNNEEVLMKLLEVVGNASSEGGFTINRSKTRILVIDQPNNNIAEIK